MNISTWIIICSLVAVCLAGIIATLQFIKQKKDDGATIKFQSDLIQKQDTIEKLQQLLGLKSDRMISTQQDLIALQNELNLKNEKIQALQEKTIRAIKGTTEPPIFSLANNLYKIAFSVTNKSSDLNATFSSTIYDFTALKKCKIREGNLIDEDCARQSVFFDRNDIKLTPQQTTFIAPPVPIPIVIGNTYKYLIYTEINSIRYLQQVYIKASSKSINTLIRILKFDAKKYKLYLEPYKNDENLDWDKEFDLPTLLILGKVS